MKRGLVTIPTDKNFIEGTKKYMELFGADAIRDCDGVSLPDDLKQFNSEVYKAYFIVREDHEYSKSHPEYLQNTALMSDRVLATSNTLDINLMNGIFKESLEVNPYNYKDYWQVFDRTTGTIHEDFEYLGNDIVRINNTIKFHEYTVNFFAKNLWDPVQVYNYHSNNWTCEKDIDMDPIYDEALNHMLYRMEKWLIENPDVTVVRFTTFFYNFFIVYKTGYKQKIWDWHIYSMSASPKMFDEFYKEYGYKMTLEDLIDEGYYSNKFRIPSKAMKDYMDLVQRKCSKWAKLFVDLCHKYNKKAMMFDGDHRIGVEPYNKYFPSIGLDAVVGAPSSGVYIEQIANMPGVKYTEGRFSPYFFPNECPSDIEGTQMLKSYWDKERRSMLKKPIDRMGFGGYLTLIDKYPNFIETVKNVCDEFRVIRENAGKNGSYNHLRVAILSTYGKMDSWMFNNNFVDDYVPDGIIYKTLLNSLSGELVQVDFISFDDVIESDISKYDSIILNGIPNTSFSGMEYWKNEKLLVKIREYVSSGKGLIGVGEPTGYNYQGKYFQLSDVLGVEKEVNYTYFLKRDKKPTTSTWILEDINIDNLDFSYGVKNVYSTTADIHLNHFDKLYGENMLNSSNIDLSTNEYFNGRSVYISGLTDSYDAYRLIYRSILWASKKEELAKKLYIKDNRCNIYYYPDMNVYAILNNSDTLINTMYFDKDGVEYNVSLNPKEIKWIYK